MSRKDPSGSKHGGPAKSQNPKSSQRQSAKSTRHNETNTAAKSARHPATNTAAKASRDKDTEKKRQEKENADLEQQYKETLTERD